MDIHRHDKQLINEYRTALSDIDESVLKNQLHQVFAPDSDIQLTFPLEVLDGANNLVETATGGYPRSITS